MNKKLLTPKTDVVFQSLFRKGNERITKALISSITKENIKDIELDKDSNLLRKYPEQKLGILDLKAIIDDGNICNIEIQIRNQYDTVKRVLFYWSKLYSEQLERGEKYLGLKKTISIIILNYKLDELKSSKKAHTVWKIGENEEKLLLTEDLEIHIIEIPKIKRILEKEPNNKLAQWIAFLDNPNDKEVFRIMKENEDIKEAMEELEVISSDKELRRLAELREKAIRDEVDIEYCTQQAKKWARLEGLEEGREEGRKEGREEGKNSKKLEIAKKMKEKGMDHETIKEITQVTEEELNNL